MTTLHTFAAKLKHEPSTYSTHRPRWLTGSCQLSAANFCHRGVTSSHRNLDDRRHVPAGDEQLSNSNSQSPSVIARPAWLNKPLASTSLASHASYATTVPHLEDPAIPYKGEEHPTVRIWPGFKAIKPWPCWMPPRKANTAPRQSSWSVRKSGTSSLTPPRSPCSH